jgi:pseudouridine-5'-phosphate glycosidase
MIAAHLAGITVFATGGIGGVHRGAEESFDISADLHELAETPVTVVAAGAKAILDLPKTLEVLETLGVPVIAVGQDALPAFWSRDSGLRRRSGSMDRRRDRGRPPDARGPRPARRTACGQPDPGRGRDSRRDDLAPADRGSHGGGRSATGVTGKAVTPFLLQWLFERTEGRTLTANVALVLNNARLAAQISRAMAP